MEGKRIEVGGKESSKEEEHHKRTHEPFRRFSIVFFTFSYHSAMGVI
jgi:hypothetical protein